jgi:ribosomal protein L37AE/L43A
MGDTVAKCKVIIPTGMTQLRQLRGLVTRHETRGASNIEQARSAGCLICRNRSVMRNSTGNWRCLSRPVLAHWEWQSLSSDGADVVPACRTDDVMLDEMKQSCQGRLIIR